MGRGRRKEGGVGREVMKKEDNARRREQSSGSVTWSVLLSHCDGRSVLLYSWTRTDACGWLRVSISTQQSLGLVSLRGPDALGENTGHGDATCLRGNSPRSWSEITVKGYVSTDISFVLYGTVRRLERVISSPVPYKTFDRGVLRKHVPFRKIRLKSCYKLPRPAYRPRRKSKTLVNRLNALVRAVKSVACVTRAELRESSMHVARSALADADGTYYFTAHVLLPHEFGGIINRRCFVNVSWEIDTLGSHLVYETGVTETRFRRESRICRIVLRKERLCTIIWRQEKEERADLCYENPLDWF